MNPTPFLIIGCIVLALLTIQLPRIIDGPPSKLNRNASIDGLRGYLAFFVFLHHAAVWQYYLTTGSWQKPPRILAQFGQTRVLIFFMITGFLFMGKILRAREKPIDWPHLFIGRLLRLGPLYFLAMILLAALVMIASGFTLHQKPANMIADIFRWLTFTIAGAPDINGVKHTRYILAGVVWTLPYEWMFYLTLPAVALIMRRKVSFVFLLPCIAGAALIFYVNHKPIFLLAFLVGMITAKLVEFAKFRAFASTRFASIFAILCVVSTDIFFQKSPEIFPMLIVGCAFALVAGGNSLFGILTSATSRTLGECAYGIYLLHGFVLYIVYRFFLGFEVAAQFSDIEYWCCVLLCTPAVVLISYASFRWIEAPAMKLTTPITNLFRARSVLNITDPIAEKINAK